MELRPKIKRVMLFNNKIVWITGASSGIGEATAYRFAQEGAKLVLTALEDDLLAKVAEKFIHKGDKVYVEGKIRYRSYDDQKGMRRYVTEVYGDNLELLSPKPTNAAYKPEGDNKDGVGEPEIPF